MKTLFNKLSQNNLVLILACFIFVQVSFAAKPPTTDTETVVKNFYRLHAYPDSLNLPEELTLNLIETRFEEGYELFRVYNVDSLGYVIVSSWDGSIPVLAFSCDGIFPASVSGLPMGFVEMLEQYESQIYSLIINDVPATPEIAQVWDKYLMPQGDKPNLRSVSPLLSTNWSQDCYYNELCPEDENAPYGYCGHVPVGCVALAMAQVMKYWEYPFFGTGSNSYNAAPYGVQYANFGNTTYQWDNMPGSLGSSNADVATLIYHCAVSVDMDFGPGGSSASTYDSRSALINYFGYDNQAQYRIKSDYLPTAWEGMLREELNSGRPVIYRGQGEKGHAWVCDGYSANNYFHMNWGWGGYANGYFYLTNLNPANITLNANQAAIMGIVPGEATAQAPTGLQALVEDDDVSLTWDEIFEPFWMHWDDGVSVGMLGISSGNFDAAACWTSSELTDYDDLYITKVSAFIGSTLPGFQLKIWKGTNANTLIYSQTLSGLTAQSWNLIELDNPVQIDAAQDTYIGFSILNQPAGAYPLGRDAGPAVDGRGDMVSFDGVNWTELQLLGIDCNWNIQAFVDISPGAKTTAKILNQSNHPRWVQNSKIESKHLIPPVSFNGNQNRAVNGYNIYRNSEKINEELVNANSYMDENLAGGTYAYYVTAVNNAGESAPGNTISVSVGMLSQSYPLKAGWNSISSLILPIDPDVQTVANPIMDAMVMMIGNTEIFYPAGQINTIGAWERHEGYMIKVDEDCNLQIHGYRANDRSIALGNGWNLISVLSECEVETVSLFSNITANVYIVKDAAGTGVYWPSKGINTLPVMQPGKAYFVKIFSNKSITFPPCD